MRLNRSLTTGLALSALLPVAGQAQQGRLFDNSWFWGVGGGDPHLLDLDDRALRKRLRSASTG